MSNTATRTLTKSCAGFTLIEIMVVVTIVAILISIGWSQYRAQLEKGKRSDAVTALIAARTALISFKSDRGNYPADPTAAADFLASANTFANVGYRASAPNGLPGAPAAPCLNERGFQAVVGTRPNSVRSCQNLWDIVVTVSESVTNTFILTAMPLTTIPLAERDEYCDSLILDHLNVRTIVRTTKGTADNIPITRCWSE